MDENERNRAFLESCFGSPVTSHKSQSSSSSINVFIVNRMFSPPGCGKFSAQEVHGFIGECHKLGVTHVLRMQFPKAGADILYGMQAPAGADLHRELLNLRFADTGAGVPIVRIVALNDPSDLEVAMS